MGKKLKKKLKIKTREDAYLSNYSDTFLKIMFNGDKEKMHKYADYAMYVKDYDDSPSTDDDDKYINNKYTKKIEKLQKKKPKSLAKKFKNSIEMWANYIMAQRVEQESYDDKDLSIATYLNSKRYKKNFLNKKNYDKKIKDLIKVEKYSMKEAKKLGFIINNDPDEELKKLKKINKEMKSALSDAYTQKHFL